MTEEKRMFLIVRSYLGNEELHNDLIVHGLGIQSLFNLYLLALSFDNQDKQGALDTAEKSLDLFEHIVSKKTNIFEANLNLSKEYVSELLEVLNTLGMGSQTLSGVNLRVHKFSLTTTTPLSIGTGEGLGRPIFEIGLAFDPLMNLPYIPGNSLKGAMRFAAETIFKREVVDAIFGTVDWPSPLLVFDSYPTDSKGHILLPHVITPHYQSPKGEVGYERDVQPTPLPFLTVAPGVKFTVIMALDTERALDRLKNVASDLDDEDLAEIIGFSLKYAAELIGIGAKTSAGFSRFECGEGCPEGDLDDES